MHLLKQLKLGHAASCHCAGGGAPPVAGGGRAAAAAALDGQPGAPELMPELLEQCSANARAHSIDASFGNSATLSGGATVLRGAAQRCGGRRRAKKYKYTVQVQEQKKNLATSL